MLCHQQGKVGVFGLAGGILVAVTVHCDDAVGIFIHYGALGVHAEGAHLIAVFLRAVNDLAFIQLIGQVGKDLCRQLHPHPQIDPIGVSRD